MARGMVGDVVDVAQAALLLGFGYVLLKPGVDGRSAFSHIVLGLSQGLQVSVPALGAAGVAPTTSAQPGVVTGPAQNPNPGGDEFNINTDPLTSSWRVTNSGAGLADVLIDAHVGFGHAGQGGNFTCVLWAQSEGYFGTPFGAGSPVTLASQNFTTNADQDWTGYGVDFTGVRVTSGIGQVDIYASIYSNGGQLFTQARLARGG